LVNSTSFGFSSSAFFDFSAPKLKLINLFNDRHFDEPQILESRKLFEDEDCINDKDHLDK